MWLPIAAIPCSQTRRNSMKILIAATVGVLLLTSCGTREVSTEGFCSDAATAIIEYKQKFGLTTIGGVYFPNTSGLTIFTELESEIKKLQESDPVKFYTLGTDQAVMKLCKIEVR